MRKIIALAFSLLACASVAQTQDQMDLCKTVSASAEAAMQARQDGKRMSDMLEIFASDEGFGELGKMIVIRAYEEPAYRTERNKQRAVRDFENTIYLECIKSAPQ